MSDLTLLYVEQAEQEGSARVRFKQDRSLFGEGLKRIRHINKTLDAVGEKERIELAVELL